MTFEYDGACFNGEDGGKKGGLSGGAIFLIMYVDESLSSATCVSFCLVYFRSFWRISLLVLLTMVWSTINRAFISFHKPNFGLVYL